MLFRSMHVNGDGSPAVRVGYTAMRALGIDIASWGSRSNQTSKEIGEILA